MRNSLARRRERGVRPELRYTTVYRLLHLKNLNSNGKIYAQMDVSPVVAGVIIRPSPYVASYAMAQGRRTGGFFFAALPIVCRKYGLEYFRNGLPIPKTLC